MHATVKVQEWRLTSTLWFLSQEVSVLHCSDMEHDHGESLCLSDGSNMMSPTKTAKIKEGGKLQDKWNEQRW